VALKQTLGEIDCGFKTLGVIIIIEHALIIGKLVIQFLVPDSPGIFFFFLLLKKSNFFFSGWVLKKLARDEWIKLKAISLLKAQRMGNKNWEETESEKSRDDKIRFTEKE
jgi:hypothetical protein